MTTFYTHAAPAPTNTPSELIPAVKARVAKFFQAVWRAFEASGQARARRDLLELARFYEQHQPSFAQELRIAATRSDR